MNLLLDILSKLSVSIFVLLMGSLISFFPQFSYSQSNGSQSSIDNIPPVIEVPNDSTVDATDSNGRTIIYKVIVTDQVDGTVVATCNPSSGSIFPIGNTKVVCEATDKNGNKGLASFQVRIQDTTPPDSMIVGSRVGWIGNINSSSATMSDRINFEVSGSDLVGVQDYECKIDSGKWTAVQDLGMGKNVCQYSQLPAGIHIFQSRATDKYGNIDNSPATFAWTVTSLEEGIQEMINLISVNLTDTEKEEFNLPLIQSQELLPKTSNDIRRSVCYNMDSYLNEINDLSLNNKLNKSQENQLIISALFIKDRLACT
jgi:hypothetical protein